MWTAEKLKSSLKKITPPTVESEHSQISNDLELLLVSIPYNPSNIALVCPKNPKRNSVIKKKFKLVFSSEIKMKI